MSDLSIFDLSGKKALVTGAAGGIGKACAIAMAKAGADVAVIDLNEQLGRATTEEIKALGRKSVFVACDVSIPEQVAEMVKEVVDALGGLHIAHNNAGIGGDPIPLTDDNAIAVWKRMLEVDLFSVFYCCREEAKYMIPQRYGKIVNTASMSGSIVNNFEFGGMPMAGMQNIAYCSAKAGVKHLTKVLAAELIQHNIYVNCISPGYIITPMTRIIQETPDFLEKENSTTPIHRQGRAEEMAGGVLYLVSEASTYTTGHDLVMDGGHTIW
jgi:NAD(P)-dependent dehydrogenase (short-subunit alcohol dehydrogenase family)